MACGSPVSSTLIKQKGDTFFLRTARHKTAGRSFTNFAALPGHTWQNTANNGQAPVIFYIHGAGGKYGNH